MLSDVALLRGNPVARRAIDVERVALVGVTLTVFLAQLACAWWFDSQGYLWGDAVSRATSALVAVYGADPHLAAIGFVWMPLPTMLEILPVSFYGVWQGVVSSGFASSIVTVMAGSLTAVILFTTARRFGLSLALSSAYTLLVCFSPMLFLFSTNGMSEGVASPFLIGTVCSLLLFWQSGQRRYIAVAGLMLAPAFACIYEAAPFGAAVLFALALGLFSRENASSAPQGRLRAVEGLSLVLLVPVMYVGVIWVIANWAITGNPLYFATSIYSNSGFISSTGTSYLAYAVKGDVFGAIGFAVVRTLPFAIPIAAIVLVRLIEGRLVRPNTLTMATIAFIVPLGLVLWQLYDGTSLGWLRYFIYPLYVAAGWGLYEIASSKRRELATAIILTGWLITIPASLAAMATPRFGQSEHMIVSSIVSGKSALDAGYPTVFQNVEPVAATLDALDRNDLVLADSSNAWTVEATVSPSTLKHNLLVTSDGRFHDALRDPVKVGVSYVLVPNPARAPQDLIDQKYPKLWQGDEPGFSLVQDFSLTGQGWRLYRVDATAVSGR